MPEINKDEFHQSETFFAECKKCGAQLENDGCRPGPGETVVCEICLTEYVVTEDKPQERKPSPRPYGDYYDRFR